MFLDGVVVVRVNHSSAAGGKVTKAIKPKATHVRANSQFIVIDTFLKKRFESFWRILPKMVDLLV